MRIALVLMLAFASACGSDNQETPSAPREPAGSGSPDGRTTVSPNVPTATPSLLGVWQVEGRDARGAYRGEVELRDAGGAMRWVRVIRYVDAKVEDGRELWWAWEGAATGSLASVDVDVSLAKSDFVKRRGTLTRQTNEAPIAVKGRFRRDGDRLSGTFEGEGISQQESWSQPKASGAKPLFATDRRIVPAHDPPSASFIRDNTLLFRSFQELPSVQPYVNRPDFKAAIYGWVVDKTDLDFYREHPHALRVVNKPVDAIALQETLVRANAYRFTLVDKARKFDDEMQATFIEPDLGMVPNYRAIGGQADQSYDGALWTAAYVASQAFRFAVTGETVARDNMLKSLHAILLLQEITGDWVHFARSLRKPTGNPACATPSGCDGWHRGVGSFAAYEWREGGNNDMLKGLFYAIVAAYPVLCENQTGFQAYCTRMRTNAKHLAEDVREGANQASTLANEMTANWIAAYVTGESKYRLRAETLWAGTSWFEPPVQYNNARDADWSGLHLNFVGSVVHAWLSQKLALGALFGSGSVEKTRDTIDSTHKEFERQRLVLWHFLKGAFGTGGLSAAWTEDAKLRLREFPFPKSAYTVDHRVSPEFSVGPWPAKWWKNDWTSPTEDRTQSLNGYPLFEDTMDTYQWKAQLDYRANTEGLSIPGADYLHAYWFARRYGLLSATE